MHLASRTEKEEKAVNAIEYLCSACRQTLVREPFSTHLKVGRWIIPLCGECCQLHVQVETECQHRAVTTRVVANCPKICNCHAWTGPDR